MDSEAGKALRILQRAPIGTIRQAIELLTVDLQNRANEGVRQSIEANIWPIPSPSVCDSWLRNKRIAAVRDYRDMLRAHGATVESDPYDKLAKVSYCLSATYAYLKHYFGEE